MKQLNHMYYLLILELILLFNFILRVKKEIEKCSRNKDDLKYSKCKVELKFKNVLSSVVERKELSMLKEMKSITIENSISTLKWIP